MNAVQLIEIGLCFWFQGNQGLKGEKGTPGIKVIDCLLAVGNTVLQTDIQPEQGLTDYFKYQTRCIVPLVL